jgi:hypothetical protein
VLISASADGLIKGTPPPPPTFPHIPHITYDTIRNIFLQCGIWSP